MGALVSLGCLTQGQRRKNPLTELEREWPLAGSLLQERAGLLPAFTQPAHLIYWFCHSALNSANSCGLHGDEEPSDLLSVFLETSTETREQGLASGPQPQAGFPPELPTGPSVQLSSLEAGQARRPD